jgi:hypothetical protein
MKNSTTTGIPNLLNRKKYWIILLERPLKIILGTFPSSQGACSIFLSVDRSINEIRKAGALYSIEIFDKKYVFIYY